MNNLVDSIEELLVEAIKMKGITWTQYEPLWTTWSLDHFGAQDPSPVIHHLTRSSAASRISTILPPYHRALHTHVRLVETLLPDTISFEDSRDAINEWAAQRHASEGGWAVEWEDLCAVEIDRWVA